MVRVISQLDLVVVMSLSLNNFFGPAIPLLVLIAGALLFLAEPLPVQVLRNAVFDQFQRLQPREYQPVPVKIIDIDDDSLKRIGQWPWPRTVLSELVTKLQQADVAAIGFDVIFAESDRTSPQAISKLWDLSGEVAKQISALPDHDKVLAKTLSSGGTVLGFSVEREEKNTDDPIRPYRILRSDQSIDDYLHAFSSSVTPLSIFNDVADGYGALTFVPDSDGVVRRVPLLVKINKTVVPSLVAETLRVSQGKHNYFLKEAESAGAGMDKIRIGKVIVPTTPKGEIWVHYTKPVAERYISAWRLLQDDFDLSTLKNHILLIGTSAPGLMDLRFSPMGRVIPGVEIHAQAIEQILGQAYLQRPIWGESVEFLMIVLGGALVGFVALYVRIMISAAVAAGFLIVTFVGAWYAYSNLGLLVDPVTPALVISVVFVLSSIVHHYSSEKRHRWVREAFSRYVSPNLVDHLVAHPDDLELGGTRRTCSFIFTDLAGFTSLMEKIDPSEAISLLNVYLDEMVAIAFRHEGTLDRIVGDAVAIMFSAPVQQDDHQARALNCALEMDTFARRYAEEINAKGIPLGMTRIGIHTGEVIVGNFGGQTMFDYRALGDPVNTAARLESANKTFGTLVSVSSETLAGCGDVAVRPIGRLVLKGKEHPLMTYEVCRDGRDEAYDAAYNLIRTEDERALNAFQSLAEERPDDPLVHFHLGRLERGENNDLVVMETK